MCSPYIIIIGFPNCWFVLYHVWLSS